MRAKFIIINLIVTLVLVVTAFASARPVQPVAAGAANIRISQVYGGGGNTGATYTNDFIEFFNPTPYTVSLDGWSVQYASATGTTWQVTPLSGNILPNSYYLVQEGAGAGGTTPLPTPDATGEILMGATAGKVALVGNSTALSGTCPLGGAIVDFVGFGATANCFEGSGPTPAPSNTTSVTRQDAGCIDTDNNNTDFTAGAVLPRNSASAPHLCGSSPITTLCPLSIRTYQNEALLAQFGAVDPDGIVSSVSITAGGVAGISLTSISPATTYGGTLSGNLFVSDTTSASVYPYDVQLTFTNNDLTPQTATCTIEVLVIPLNCPPPLNPVQRIGAVQGTGTASPVVGQTVSILGTVTADFQADNQLKGYYLQDQGDGNALTSDGIFVYDTSIDVKTGDKVMFQGTVAEYNGQTEMTVVYPNPGTYICGLPLPKPSVTAIALPQAAANAFEAYEGMLVSLSQTLTVSQNYFQGRYGQVTLSSDGRMYHPNNGNDLGDTVELDARRFIVLDDGSTVQNPNPVPYYDLAKPLRAGDTTSGLSGIMDQGPINATTPYILGYRLQPTTVPVFNQVNLRPAAPEIIGHDISVMGFNLYNFFTTLNDPDNTYPNPPYTTSNEPRGANNPTEFERQVLKLVAAIRGADPVILGVTEMEKYEGSASTAADTYLLDRLNEGLAEEDQWDIIKDPALGFGGDVIKNTIYYKSALVTQVGDPVSYNIPDPAAPTLDLFDRYPVAQTFQIKADKQKFTVVVNHLKSKTCTDATGVELDYGQGCWNAKRTRQAAALLSFVDDLVHDSGDADVLLIGDYNAYGEEDPINVFEGAGMADMMERVPAASRYTYIFDGLSGYLDHALATPSLAGYTKNVVPWHINADEAAVINYDNNYNPPGYYTPDAFRSADHDPVWTRLNVSDEPVLLSPLVNQSAIQGIPFTYNASVSFYDADVPEFDALTFTATGVPAWLTLNPATGVFSGTPGNADVTQISGPVTITVRATDTFHQYVESTFTLSVLNANDAPTVATALLDQTTTQGSLLTYQFAANSFDDIDILYGDSLSYTASGNPTWFAFTPGTRTFSGTPGPADVGGPFTITVRATDEGGLFVEDSFTLTVLNINDAPIVATALADQTATQGLIFTFEAGKNFLDYDVLTSGDVLTFSAVGVPAWLTFYPATGALTGTPANADVTQLSGPVSITVRATDSFGLSVEDTFLLSVLNVNDAPFVAIPILDGSVLPGQLFTRTLPAGTFSDPDLVYGDVLTYTAARLDGTALPTWLTFTASTLTFSGTPSGTDVGSLVIKVTARDLASLETSDVFTIRVGLPLYLPVVLK